MAVGYKQGLSGEGAGLRSWEERKTTSALTLAMVKGERVPHWLHLWPIKQLGPVGGEARKGEAGFYRRRSCNPCWEESPLRGALLH